MSAGQDYVAEPVHVPPAYEHIVERLRSAIWLGELIPGERLPSERSLAEGFAVSRLTVREALRTLQGEGLLVIKRGSAGGATVVGREMSQAERHRLVLGSRDVLREAQDVREGIEPLSARLAAERASEEEIKRLESSHEELLGSTDIPSFRRADSAFHLAIADATHNAMLAGVVKEARTKLFMSFDVQEFEVLKSTTVDAHAGIMKAIKAHDGPRAEKAMAVHLEEAWQEVLAVLDAPVPSQ